MPVWFAVCASIVPSKDLTRNSQPLDGTPISFTRSALAGIDVSFAVPADPLYHMR